MDASDPVLETLKLDDEDSEPSPNLPPEILIQIIEVLRYAAKRERKRARSTLLRFCLASKQCAALGFPVLLKEVDFSVRSQSFVLDALKSNYCRHIRYLITPWYTEAGLLDRILAQCRNLGHLSLSSNSALEMKNLLRPLEEKAPKSLQKLDIIIRRTQFLSLASDDVQRTSLPNGIRHVTVEFESRSNPAAFLDIISRCPTLESLSFSNGVLSTPVYSWLQANPRAAALVRTIELSSENLEHVAKGGVFTGVRSVTFTRLNHLGRADFDNFWSHLGHFHGLKDLTASNLSSKDLSRIKELGPIKLKSLKLRFFKYARLEDDVLRDTAVALGERVEKTWIWTSATKDWMMSGERKDQLQFWSGLKNVWMLGVDQ